MQIQKHRLAEKLPHFIAVLVTLLFAGCAQEAEPMQQFKMLGVGMTNEQLANWSRHYNANFENNRRLLIACNTCKGFLREDVGIAEIDGWNITIGYKKPRREGGALYVLAKTEVDAASADQMMTDLISGWGEPAFSDSAISKITNCCNIRIRDHKHTDHQVRYIFWGNANTARRVRSIVSRHQKRVEDYDGPQNVSISPDIGYPVGALVEYDYETTEMVVVLKGAGRLQRYEE